VLTLKHFGVTLRRDEVLMCSLLRPNHFCFQVGLLSHHWAQQGAAGSLRHSSGVFGSLVLSGGALARGPGRVLFTKGRRQRREACKCLSSPLLPALSPHLRSSLVWGAPSRSCLCGWLTPTSRDPLPLCGPPLRTSRADIQNMSLDKS